ncbi:MAG: MoaD/ThiS family protein [Campylobacterota bacterium]
MVKVEFLGPINKDSLEVDIDNLSQLSEILNKNSEIKSWLDKCAVAINDTLVSSKDVKLQSGDKVSLLPPVCGG